ncbi:41171_t:CDS:1, partial [Gigaspora margarita]
MLLQNTPAILSKASKKNLRKKNLHMIKKAEVENPDHLFLEEGPGNNTGTSRIEKKKQIYFMILR